MGLSGIFGNAGVVEPDKLESDYGQFMCDGETIEIGFVVIRDTFIFTNKRLVIVDIQGMTGKKRSYLSIPYGKITKYSIETSGHFDLDAELNIWVGNDPQPIEKSFNKKVDIYDLQKILSTHVLG